jgi:hypothetical protein
MPEALDKVGERDEKMEAIVELLQALWKDAEQQVCSELLFLRVNVRVVFECQRACMDMRVNDFS